MFAGLLVGLLQGCGPTCQSTCTKLYQPGGECQIERPGRTTSELYDSCMSACDDALSQPGEVGSYNPYERQNSATSATSALKNDQRAAVWMDCIAETSCDYLEDGYCAPVW